jgi:hypothetical protein
LYEQSVAVGTVLPAEGFGYYQVRAEYGHVSYRYAYVNNEVDHLDPSTSHIVQLVQWSIGLGLAQRTEPPRICRRLTVSIYAAADMALMAAA